MALGTNPHPRQAVPAGAALLMAAVVLERVTEEQRLDVDCVSGATRSSKLYLPAVLDSLTGETVYFKARQ